MQDENPEYSKNMKNKVKRRKQISYIADIVTTGRQLGFIITPIWDNYRIEGMSGQQVLILSASEARAFLLGFTWAKSEC